MSCVVSWFSFANARRDGEMKCSPAERLEAIYRYFAWCREQGVTLIGCTEANKTQNDMDWHAFYANVESRYGYKVIIMAVQGDKNPTTAFGVILLVDTKNAPSTHYYDENDTLKTDGLLMFSGSTKEVTLTPEACKDTRFAVYGASLCFQKHKLLYCHLSLSVNGKDAAYENLVYELKKIETEYVQKGWIAFGDFNLTRESKRRLLLEEPALVDALHFAFGRDDEDVSFITFPHDTIPASAFEDKPEHILRRYTTEESDRLNVVSALDAVCSLSPLTVSRFLPYGVFREIPRNWSVKQVIQCITEDDIPPVNVTDWASDHWIIKFEC